MLKIFRFLVCCIVSFAVVYLSGYRNLMNDIAESLAVTAFCGASIVLSVVLFLIWETYLCNKNKINELTQRIDELENKKFTE